MDAAFEKLGQQYLDQFTEFSPVRATALGDHRFDDRLDEISEEARATELQWLREFRLKLDGIDDSQLSRANQVDLALLKHALDAQQWRLTELQEWAWNPLIYTGLAGDAIYALMARDFAPRNERLMNAAKRLEQFPRFLEQVRGTLQFARVPQVHAETAAAQNRGILSTLDHMVRPIVSQLPPADRDRLDRAMKRAERAIREHQHWLETELLPRSEGDFRLGIELYASKLRYALHTPLSRQEIHDLARQR